MHLQLLFSSAFSGCTSTIFLQSIREVGTKIFRRCQSISPSAGLPTKQAFKELDYVGAVLFILAATLILVGIVYTTTLPSDDPKVIGTLVSGFACLVVFGCWETFAPLKQPLT